MHELEIALRSMDPRKAPGPNGMITVFFKRYWDIIKEDYLSIMKTAVETDTMPPKIMCGLNFVAT